VRSAIVTVGNEILDGFILNTNSHYLAARLQQFDVVNQTMLTLPDKVELIVSALSQLIQTHELILITGGLGPTEDDRTTEAVASALSLPLVRHEVEADKLQAKFKQKNLPIPQSNFKQVYFPKGAIALDNPLGTAPGFYLRHDKCHIFCLPGVPSEMTQVFETLIEPELEKLAGRIPAKRHVVKTMGISEAQLIETVKASGILSGYEWGNMARPDGVFLSIKLQNPKASESEIAHLNTSLGTLLGKTIYGYNKDTLPRVVQELALSQGVTLSCAESCTGGYFGKAVTDIDGSSAYFMGGIIAYSNTVKTSVLHVSPDLLKAYGAVSVECAEAMARGCQSIFRSHYAVSITGIAGPGGGTPEKPVGTVCFGIATPEARVLTYRRLFFGNRDDIRKKSLYHGLNYLRLAICLHAL